MIPRRSTPINTIRESTSSSYVPRTIDNINRSDGTLAILWGASTGTLKTIIYCRKASWVKETWKHWNKDTPRISSCSVGRPYCVIETRNLDRAEGLVVGWSEMLYGGSVKTLNVAGHRESSFPGIQEFTRELVIRLILWGVVRERCVSGGQCGADAGAWDAGIELGFPIGGIVPRFGRCENGTIDPRYFSYGR